MCYTTSVNRSGWWYAVEVVIPRNLGYSDLEMEVEHRDTDLDIGMHCHYIMCKPWKLVGLLWGKAESEEKK